MRNLCIRATETKVKLCHQQLQTYFFAIIGEREGSSVISLPYFGLQAF